MSHAGERKTCVDLCKNYADMLAAAGKSIYRYYLSLEEQELRNIM